jgi:predicted lipoprotein
MKRRAALAALGPLLLSCRAPWTVRRIEDVEASGAPQEGRRFDAAEYVESIWDNQVVAAARAAADFRAWNRTALALVQGTGRVVRRDSAGGLLVDLPPYDGKADLVIDVATAIHGTALRDALPFIQFSQFVNQVDFAKVAGALNARAASVAEAAGSDGDEISFAGAVVPPTNTGLPEIIPVILAVSREGK